MRYARSDLNNASMGLFVFLGLAGAMAAFALDQRTLGLVVMVAILVIAWLIDRKFVAVEPFTVVFRRSGNELQIEKSFFLVPYSKRRLPFTHLTTTTNDIVLHDGGHSSLVNVTDSLELDKVDIALSGTFVDAFQVIGDSHSIHQGMVDLLSGGEHINHG